MIAARMEVWVGGERIDFAILAVLPGISATRLAAWVLANDPHADTAKVWLGVTEEQPDREPDAEVTR